MLQCYRYVRNHLVLYCSYAEKSRWLSVKMSTKLHVLMAEFYLAAHERLIVYDHTLAR